MPADRYPVACRTTARNTGTMARTKITAEQRNIRIAPPVFDEMEVTPWATSREQRLTEAAY